MSAEYRKKINELQAELEGKAKEVNKEYEKFDAILVNKKALLKRIGILNEDILARKQIIDKLDGQIETAQEDLEKKSEKDKTNNIGLSDELTLLQSLLDNAQRERLAIEGLEADAETWKAKADKAQTAYAKTLQKLMKASNALKEVRKSMKSEKDDFEKDKQELEDGQKKLEKDKENFYTIKKDWAFYAKRHLRLYRKEGRAIPQHLIDIIENLK